MTKLRRIELIGEDFTKIVRMKDLEVGDVFKIYEPETEEQVGTAWKVARGPELNNAGQIEVIVDPEPPLEEK
jgi:hypothetical protein